MFLSPSARTHAVSEDLYMQNVIAYGNLLDTQYVLK